MKSLFMCLLILSTTGILWAQEDDIPVKFDGSVRMRPEADGRDFDKDSDINTYTFLRTRIGAMIEPASNLNVYIQIQDSRHFGSANNTVTNSSNIDLHQGYFSAEYLWDIPLHFKAGRMEMSYSNERLIGAVAWDNVGRAFDGFRVSYGDKSRVDLFSTVLRESHTPVRGAATPGNTAGQKNEDSNFSGLYYQYRGKPGYILDLYGLWDIDRRETNSDKDMDRFTIGTHSNGKLADNLGYRAQLAYQSGKRRQQNIRAFMISASLAYTFQTSTKPSLSIGLDYLSGMTSDDSDYKVFDTLFATNHKFYGYMDYFINIPVNTEGRGLQDFMLKFHWPFAGKWRIAAHYHNFRAAKQRTDGESKSFGNELDLTLAYNYNKTASFVYGLSAMAPGDLFKARFGNDDLGVWSYLMFTIKF